VAALLVIEPWLAKRSPSSLSTVEKKLATVHTNGGHRWPPFETVTSAIAKPVP
jgi:hypothetical protein